MGPIRIQRGFTAVGKPLLQFHWVKITLFAIAQRLAHQVFMISIQRNGTQLDQPEHLRYNPSRIGAAVHIVAKQNQAVYRRSIFAQR